MDLAQEAFLEAFAHIDRFEVGRPFGPYVYRIVHNRALNLLKRRSHRSAPKATKDDVLAAVSAPVDPDEHGAAVDRKQLALHLKQAIEALPDKLKGAFVLRYLEQHSVADVAAILALPVNTIKTHLFRARNQLRSTLRWWFDEH